MKNFIQPGGDLEFVAPSGGVVSGTPVQIGQFVVIPKTTAAVGVTFIGSTEGVFEVPKVSAQAWAVGDLIYFNDSGPEFTNVSASGHLLCGLATEVAANPTAVGRVKLTGDARADVV